MVDASRTGSTGAVMCLISPIASTFSIHSPRLFMLCSVPASIALLPSSIRLLLLLVKLRLSRSGFRAHGRGHRMVFLPHRQNSFRLHAAGAHAPLHAFEAFANGLD